MNGNINNLVRDVIASPLGDVIASVGEGVAAAQQALDEGSLAQTLEIYSEGGEDALTLLRDIGYRPTFYTLPDTTGEVRVSLHLGKSLPGSGSVTSGRTLAQGVSTQLNRIGRNIGIRPRLYATPVDAGYANRYGYQANVSAKITFKIVPVPPPEGFDELRVVPVFVGKTIADTQRTAESLDLELAFQDADGTLILDPVETSVITKQAPVEQELVRAGDQVLLTLSH